MSKYIPHSISTNVLVMQALRSGTSIGANISEAQYAQSAPDFISKISISLKESAETLYWLELLYNNGDLTQEQYESMFKDCDELRRMLIASLNTARKNHSKSVREPETPYGFYKVDIDCMTDIEEDPDA